MFGKAANSTDPAYTLKSHFSVFPTGLTCLWGRISGRLSNSWLSTAAHHLSSEQAWSSKREGKTGQKTLLGMQMHRSARQRVKAMGLRCFVPKQKAAGVKRSLSVLHYGGNVVHSQLEMFRWGFSHLLCSGAGQSTWT